MNRWLVIKTDLHCLNAPPGGEPLNRQFFIALIKLSSPGIGFVGNNDKIKCDLCQVTKSRKTLSVIFP